MKDDCEKQNDSAGRQAAISLFAHMLLHGGEGNPFRSISAEWFVDTLAPKMQEIFDEFAERIIVAMFSMDWQGGPEPVIVAPKKYVFDDFCAGCPTTDDCAMRGGCMDDAVKALLFGRRQ